MIGTREPAPAIFPILLKISRPVKKALNAINKIVTTVPEEVSSKPLYLQKEKVKPRENQVCHPLFRKCSEW